MDVYSLFTNGLSSVYTRFTVCLYMGLLFVYTTFTVCLLMGFSFVMQDDPEGSKVGDGGISSDFHHGSCLQNVIVVCSSDWSSVETFTH